MHWKEEGMNIENNQQALWNWDWYILVEAGENDGSFSF